jgi:hypothetical protein
LLGALLLLSAPSCAPFIVPPARVAVGPAARLDSVPGTRDDAPQAGAVAVRAALHPLDLVDGAEANKVDVGVGYAGEFGATPEAQTVYGPFVQVGVYPWNAPIGARTHLRFGGSAAIERVYRSGGSDAGVGGTLGASLELLGPVSGPFAGASHDGAVLGMARGVWSVGLFADASMRSFPEGAYRSVTAGVSLRVPFLAGIACCAFHSSPHESGDFGAPAGGHEVSRVPARPRQRP